MTYSFAHPYRTALKVSSVTALAAAVVAACGSEEKGCTIGSFDCNNQAGITTDAGNNPGGSNNVGGSGVIINNGTGGSGNTGFGGAGGEACVGTAFGAEPLPVDMYIMFDKSTSMEEQLGTDGRSKWDSAVSALQSFVQNPRAAGIGVGLQYFGLTDVCNPDAYAIPEVPLSQLPGVATDIINSTANTVPATLTPTAPALQGALRYMQAWSLTHPERASVVVLVTDGFPTQCGVQCTVNEDCQSNACVSGMCDPGTSIAEIEALAAQYAAMDPPVLTFVVGFGQGLANLNNIARGGGTDEAFLIDSGNVEEQFINAMLSISSTPLSCEFDIPVPENPEDVVDPTKVQVLYTPVATGTPEEIPKVNYAGDCVLNYEKGWYYDYDAAPTKILICPETCKSFAAGSVSIALGCTPIIVDTH
jgi:hypothetical protein